MRTRVPAATSFLILLLLLLGFLAGCGGDQSGSGGSQGDEQQGGGKQQGGEQQQQQQQGREATNAGRSSEKVALGSIQSVDPERRRIVMKPAFKAQGGNQITFKVTKDAQVHVNDQEADLSDVETGKQAQISYVVNNGVNRATSVEIVGDGG